MTAHKRLLSEAVGESCFAQSSRSRTKWMRPIAFPMTCHTSRPATSLRLPCTLIGPVQYNQQAIGFLYPQPPCKLVDAQQRVALKSFFKLKCSLRSGPHCSSSANLTLCALSMCLHLSTSPPTSPFILAAIVGHVWLWINSRGAFRAVKCHLHNQTWHDTIPTCLV